MNILFDALTATTLAQLNEQDAIKVSGKTTSADSMTSGGFDVAHLVLTLGSAGAFTALTSVLVAYFKNRPRAKLYFKSKSKDSSITITASNCDSKALAEALSKLAANK